MDGISTFNKYAKEMLPTVGILDRLAKPLDIKYRKTMYYSLINSHLTSY